MSCYYSYIGGGCTSTSVSDAVSQPFDIIKFLTGQGAGLGIETCPFTSLGNYDDEEGRYKPTATWEACIAATNNPKGKMQSSFATSMAFVGQQTLVYSWLAFAVLYRSLIHYEWLLSTIVFMLYALIGLFCYYPFDPFLPYPHQTAATVSSLSKYVNHNMYNGTYILYTSGSSRSDPPTAVEHKVPIDDCHKAYLFNEIFLVVQYLSVAIVFALLIVAVRAELTRRRYQLIPKPVPLKLTLAPNVIAFLCFAAYAVMTAFKGMASVTNLDVITANDSPASVFPFAKGSVDVPTVFLIVTTMGVIRGTTRGSTSAFRLAAVAAILHVCLLYPIITGSVEVIRYNDIFSLGKDAFNAEDSNPDTSLRKFFGTGCKGFWQTYYLSFYNDAEAMSTSDFITQNFVHPSPDQASALCRDTWYVFYSEVVVFALMHLQVVACFVVYRANGGRATEMLTGIYDPQPPLPRGVPVPVYEDAGRGDPLLGPSYDGEATYDVSI